MSSNLLLSRLDDEVVRELRQRSGVVVVLSGGLDSSTLLHFILKFMDPEQVSALSFNYGQSLSRELDCALSQSSVAGVRHEILDLSNLRNTLSSALTTQPGTIPDIKDVLGHPQPPTYVPFRNQLFLTLACAQAETLRVQSVAFGAQLHDLYGYWDTSELFVEKFNDLISLNRTTSLQVFAPFAGLSKTQVLALGLEIGVDYAKTWSCYRGRHYACGTCPTCAERLKAFQNLNVIDPVLYEEIDTEQ